ncbi:SusC/RagA family TonB-linked outer membrane protein [Mucilaginibacter pedocola]|uniref:SusC/RagA family TonB-linked outer membrane protein n=1 Tax=Mucilaginibacter pedocola TaxID=1792845 RepID=A0A1S9PEJ1_9SPHI|nr:TonB-dependent receptor [Mucilaginibacter pedocola]OOQ59366.1 SusC/RagA family TonB-linked outer membrane protein [Mucilaginibacter pedocola]
MFKSLLLKGRVLCLLLCCMVSSLVVTAQTKHTGRVIGSDDKLPVVGATVRVKGTTTGTQTDVNGQFSLSVKNGDVLVISYLGYTTQEVTVSSENIGITLQASNNSLNEVVVTGYASQKKKDLVGAVAVVDVAALNRTPTASIENQLQGQASGVTVVNSGAPGQTPQVKIRGANTFGNNQPLYVVDGVPTTNVNDLNPNDIASMQVLKDAGSASIYGARASNGVIIVTTKRGNGKTNISYDAYYGTQNPKGGNVYDLLDPTEMMALRRLAIKNSTAAGTAPNYSSNLYGPNGDVLPDYISAGGNGPAGIKDGDPAVDPSKYNVNPLYTTGDASGFYRITRANKAGTDWYHQIFNAAPIQSHNLNLNGSNDQASYLFSLNYFNQQGVLINTYNKRYTLRANTNFNVTKNFRVGENVAYSITDNPQANQNDEGSAIGMSFREQRIIPVRDIMGNYAGSNTANLGNARNPVAIQERTMNNRGSSNRLFGNIYAEADFFKHITLRTQFGGEYYAGYFNYFNFPEYENSENGVTNTYGEGNYTGYNYTWTNTARYHQVFGKHDVTFLAGSEQYNNYGRNIGGTNSGYYTFDPNYVNLSTGTGTPTAYSNSNRDKLFSLIGRLDYTYNNRVLLSATIRRDGSSRFLNNTFGWFPAASLGYRLSEESFVKSIGWVNDLKIRGSYGVMGNQINVDPANAFTTYGQSRNNSYYDLTGSSTGTVPGFSKNYIGNPDAKWEKDKNLNVGFDATLFNSKLEISADYYVKKITDLLVAPPLAGTAGTAQSPAVNVAAMDNSGFDIAVTTHQNLGSELKMNATLTFTSYKNEVKKITLGNKQLTGQGGRFSGTYITRSAVGGPVSSFYGYQTDGFWDSQAEMTAANTAAGGTYQDGMALGRFKYKDMNGDGKITADDRTNLGSPNPDFTTGLNLDFSYKRFDLSMFMYASVGAKIWNDVKWWTDFYSNFAGAKSRTALYDSWTPDHMNAKAPIQELNGSFASGTTPNSYYVENGSFLRLRTVQLGYTFNANALKAVGMSKLRVYVSGANLLTITGYSGVDPEITGSGDNGGQRNSVDFGVDRGSYAPVRTLLLGVQVKF